MEQQSALLAAWMQGASIATLHFLIERPELVIEEHLRKELHKVRDDAAAAPAPLVASAPPVIRRNGMPWIDAAPAARPKPGQAIREKMAAECDVKRAKPGMPKTAPTSIVKREAGLGPEELRGYPPTMRMKNQDTSRKVYQQLKAGPKKLDEIAETLGVSYDGVWLACRNMLKAGLVARTEEQPYRWTLVQRPADAATGD